MNLLVVFVSVLSLSSAFAQEPQREGFTSNGFTMVNFEYWGNCGYDGGRGVSFLFNSNRKPENQACARQAYNVLKGAIDENRPELSELAAARGPTRIYLIMSDCTASEEPFPASVWHYNALPTGRGGLIKFHAVSRNLVNEAGETTIGCEVPTADEFYEFVRSTRDRITGL